MRDRSDIRDQADFETHRLHRADGILAAGSGSLHIQLNFLNSELLSGFDRLFGGKTSRERRAFARAFEAC